jgi:hypothetical protein
MRKILFFVLLAVIGGCKSKPDAGKLSAAQSKLQEILQTNKDYAEGMKKVQAKIEQYGTIENVPEGGAMERILKSRTKEAFLKKQGETCAVDMENLIKQYAEGEITTEEYQLKYQALMVQVEDYKISVTKYLERVVAAMNEN